MKRIKALIFVSVIFVLVSVLLSSCACEHEWKNADCTAPATCLLCGETAGEPQGHIWELASCLNPMYCIACGEETGEPLAHAWLDADCYTAKTCADCGAVDGVALEHSWQDATCSTPKTCAACALTEGEPIAHTWTVATTEAPMTCTYCGATEGERIVVDERFKTDKCRELFGTWAGYYVIDGEPDFGITVEGVDLDYKMHMTFTFGNDGSLNISAVVDEVSFMPAARIACIEALYKEFELQGINREDADDAMIATYGSGVEDYVDEYLAGIDLSTYTQSFDYVYYADDGNIYAASSWDNDLEPEKYELDGHTFKMNFEGTSLVLKKIA